MEVADTESEEATYQELFRSLKGRGLREASNWWSPTSTRASQGGRRAALPGSFAPEVPGPLREEPPGHGGPRQAQGARRGPARDFSAAFSARALKAALKIASSVAEKWREKGSPKVAEHLEKSMWRSASLAWRSPSPTQGAFAPPTAWRG